LKGRGSGSWIWGRVTGSLWEANGSLAATGIVRPEGRIDPVVLEPKVVACLRHERVTGLLTPWQRFPELQGRAGRADAATRAAGAGFAAAAPARRFGYAAERGSLRRQRCRHLADAA